MSGTSDPRRTHIASARDPPCGGLHTHTHTHTPSLLKPALFLRCAAGGTQSKLKFKVKLGELTNTDKLYIDDAVQPMVDEANGVGRFVLAPPTLWPDAAQPDSGGFVGKIVKIDKRAGKAALQFIDGKFHFDFNTVLTFKALS